MEFEITIVRRKEELTLLSTAENLAHALSRWLGDWGDPPDQILESFDYVFSGDTGRGGFLVLARDGEELVGALVMLNTGMGGYIPRNHLVYVAVDPDRRGGGLGELLVKAGLETAGSTVSLHIDRDNPARRLYERLGFSVKYLEMRTSNGNNDSFNRATNPRGAIGQ